MQWDNKDVYSYDRIDLSFARVAEMLQGGEW